MGGYVSGRLKLKGHRRNSTYSVDQSEPRSARRYLRAILQKRCPHGRSADVATTRATVPIRSQSSPVVETPAVKLVSHTEESAHEEGSQRDGRGRCRGIGSSGDDSTHQGVES